MTGLLLFNLIVSPFLAAGACYVLRIRAVRSTVVLAAGGVLIASSVLLALRGPFAWSPGPLLAPVVREGLRVADFLMLIIVFFYGIKHRHGIIIMLSILQILLLTFLEFFLVAPHEPHPAVYCDHLSLIMVLIISVVGSIICIYAIPYMKNHERHREPSKVADHRFFFVLILFLGAMNGLALTNDMIHFYFFFELTTLCSFLLIGHDGTEVAIKNALQALWMNSLGGAVLATALVCTYSGLGTADMQKIIQAGSSAAILLLSMTLICIAAFIKAAQVPFQSWLLGAMVAPTPVSALLHSSTMVKAGVYLALRFAPAFAGTFLSLCMDLFGAFTFLATAGLAVGERNGKKILAYSTVSNLGLIFACTGINTQGALTAAILLIVFHSVSKALLFLCIGTIEQKISSRDIEDMQGLYSEMPVTAIITVMGAITMILPPFGMVLGKWMAMEAAARNLPTILMLAVGSAMTVVYWARWAGILMSAPFVGSLRPEKQPALIWIPLVLLCGGAVALSFGAPWLYSRMILPALSLDHLLNTDVLGGAWENPLSAFAVHPLFLAAILGFVAAVLVVRKAQKARVTTPYLSGVHTDEPGVFAGPMNLPVKASVENYYLPMVFGEERLTLWANIVAGALLILTIGGTL